MREWASALARSSTVATTPGSHAFQSGRLDWRLVLVLVVVVLAVAIWQYREHAGVSPRAVKPQGAGQPSATMGPLEVHTNRRGRDMSIGGAPADNAGECADLCGAHARCEAMSFAPNVDSKGGRCWLKESVPEPTPNPLMTSAVKLHPKP